MNGNSVIVDSNILIYLVGGDKTLSDYLENLNVYVSFLTELELLSFQKLTEAEEKIIKRLLSNCIIVDINDSIKKTAIVLRKSYHLKIPDSIICSTSLYLDLPLVTSDSQFKKIKELNLVLYDRS